MEKDRTKDMTSKKYSNSSRKQDTSRRHQASDSSEEIAMLIKQTMATELESLQETVAHMLKESLEKALDPIQKHIAENGSILRWLKEQAGIHANKCCTVFYKTDNIQVRLLKNEEVTNPCLAEETEILKKLNDLEDRSRRNNVRLVNLPTGAEGDDRRGYLQQMLPNWIPALNNSHSTPLEIDRAHKIFSNNTSRSLTMIYRQAILQGVRKAKPTLLDGTRLQFFADYSLGMMQQWQGYKEIRAKLRQKGIDSFLIYPAILRVNIKGMKMSFNLTKEAKEAVKSSVLGRRPWAKDRRPLGGDGTTLRARTACMLILTTVDKLTS